jgi:hypothetical protein
MLWNNVLILEKEKKMKKSITIAMVIALFVVLVISGTALAFDPQPEPHGIIAKLEMEQNPGVISAITFYNLFPFASGEFLPFGGGIIQGFDPQPEPPGKLPDR